MNALFIGFGDTASQYFGVVTRQSGCLQIRPASLPKFVNTILTWFAQVDPGFQEMDRRAMAHTVRMEVFPPQCGDGRLGALQICGEQVTDPKAAQRLPTLVEKKGDGSL